MRIATVDDDVAFFQMWNQLFDYFIHGLAGFHHQHDFARLRQGRNQILNGGSTADTFAGSATGEKFFHLFNGAVKGSDRKAIVGHVEYEIFAHDGQANQADIGLWFHSEIESAVEE